MVRKSVCAGGEIKCLVEDVADSQDKQGVSRQEEIQEYGAPPYFTYQVFREPRKNNCSGHSCMKWECIRKENEKYPKYSQRTPSLS